VAAIATVDYRPVGTGKLGPITEKLRDFYFDIVRGKVEAYRDWCTPVYSNQ
jgi:branched-chain amino acid aminotransferase